MTWQTKRFTAKEVERFLTRGDYVLISQKRNHLRFWNQQVNIQFTIPVHGDKHLPIETLRQILPGFMDSEWETELL